MGRVATIIAFGSLALTVPLSAAEHSVPPGTLRRTLEVAAPGDTLRLGPGVHRGSFTIDVALHLVGEPGSVIEGEGRGHVLILAADEITVRDLTLRGSGSDLSQDDSVVLIAQVERVTVERCRVEARAFGIYLQRGRGHVIAGNEIHGDASLPVARRGNGIHLWHTEHNDIRDNRLSEVRDGIYLSFAHDNQIQANHGKALRYGIHYMYSERNTLTGNRFSRCRGGIALMFSMRNRIEANEAVENEQFGILCQQIEHSELLRNRVAGNGRGFYLQNSAANGFAGNRIEGNGAGVYLTAGSERNRFTANTFSGNLVQVFDDHPGGNTFHEDGRGNFWSDYAGFDWNRDGVGDTPYRLHTAASALMARRPVTRWFWMSPVLALLDWWDARLTIAEAGSLDPFPLVEEASIPPREMVP